MLASPSSSPRHRGSIERGVDGGDRQRDLVQTIVRKTIELGCNPGDGGVQIQRIPDEIPGRFKNRLLTEDEIDLLNAGGHTN
jgi:hypothetical protein